MAKNSKAEELGLFYEDRKRTCPRCLPAAAGVLDLLHLEYGVYKIIIPLKGIKNSTALRHQITFRR